MNDETLKALFQNLPAIITALGVLLTAYLSYRSNQQSKANALKLEQVEHSVNGKMQELLDVSTTAAKAEGKSEERTEQLARDTPVKVELVEKPVPVKVIDEGEK